jgi:leucyl-tRNA synthetase
VRYAVQVNGKLRGEIDVAVGAEKDAVLASAKAVPNVARYLAEGASCARSSCRASSSTWW